MVNLSEEEFGSYDEPELRGKNILAAIRDGRIKKHFEGCSCPMGKVGCEDDKS